MNNAVPAGFETDENLDVSLRADMPTMEDYEDIPIEQFVILVIPEAGESQALIENSIETKDQRLSMLQTAINSFYNN